jgi:glucosamine-6-phosphate deaminase
MEATNDAVSGNRAAGVYKKDQLRIKRYPGREALGQAAARDTAAKILELLERQPAVRMVFAAAPSQNEFLAALAGDSRLDWSRISVFHMDEYIGLDRNAPQGFGNFLRDRLFGKKPFQGVHYIDGSAPALEAECARYSGLLREAAIDIVCMGIGENAHIAFNDPPVADFNDPCLIKVVRLDRECREQQVHDGCFSRLEEVPTHALTLTVPALVNAAWLFCMVPGAAKKNAVSNTLSGDITERCPASILRRCPHGVLYVDHESGAEVPALAEHEAFEFAVDRIQKEAYHNKQGGENQS